MRASTAFMVGVGTVGIAISGGLGGGLLIGNIMNPSPPKHAAEAAQPRHAAASPMPASSPLPYTAATLALTDPALDGRVAAGRKQAESTSTAPAASLAPASATGDQQAKAAASGEAAKPGATEQVRSIAIDRPTTPKAGEQAAKPADNAAQRQPTEQAQQAPSTKQASAPEDAFAKARDSDLKHADKHRLSRAQRWADRHRHDQEQAQDQNRDQNPDQVQDQNQDQSKRYSEQQGRDDRTSSDRGGDSAPRYSYSYPDRRYRDDRSRYRDADRGDDDRAARYDERGPRPRYYVDDAPRFEFPNVQLFGSDD